MGTDIKAPTAISAANSPTFVIDLVSSLVFELVKIIIPSSAIIISQKKHSVNININKVNN
jgi:hypothetical protein